MNTTLIHTEDELHALLDSLTLGQIVTATWEIGEYRTTITGPVKFAGTHVFCGRTIRFSSVGIGSGGIVPKLTSFEVTVEQPVTVTRDDPAALLALVESLADGQKVSAEWREGAKIVKVTGEVCRSGNSVFVGDLWYRVNTLARGPKLDDSLHSVTTDESQTVRWERDTPPRD